MNRDRFGAWWAAAAMLVLVSLAACAPRRDRPATAAAAVRSFTILAVNDVYRIEGVDGGTYGGLARLRSLRAELDRAEGEVLFLHAGDFLFPSFLSRSFDGRQMIDALNRLDGDGESFDRRMFITFGNHEFDQAELEDAATLDANVEASQFTWLGSNVEFVRDEDGEPLVAADNLLDSEILTIGGVRVGLFSLTTDEKHPAYVARFAEPAEVARRMVADLRRRGAEVVVALTHLQLTEDVEVLDELAADGPDVVLGGHEHHQITERVGERLILKADAEAKTALVVRVTVAAAGRPQVTFEFRELGPDAPADPEVTAAVEAWVARHERDYCSAGGRSPDCLDEVLGHTRARLVGEELEIRRFETNLGNWILDRALARFRPDGVVAAFVNAGSLRLNQDVPANSDVTLRHVEEIFQYPSQLRILRISGRVLQAVVSHAVTGWTGDGKWLQISGFAFRHDPERETADRLTLLTPQGPRPIAPDDELLVVTNSFLADPATGQDGYTMLAEDMVVPYDGEPVELRDLVVAGLAAAGAEGIAPEVEGRICNTGRGGPCLAAGG